MLGCLTQFLKVGVVAALLWWLIHPAVGIIVGVIWLVISIHKADPQGFIK